MPIVKSFAPLAVVVLMAGSAAAQSPQRLAVDPSASQKPDGPVRVQTSINFYLPGPTGESDDAQKLRERARRIVYEMAARECDLAREVLAKECRLESVNSSLNVNRQYGQQPQEGYNVIRFDEHAGHVEVGDQRRTRGHLVVHI